MREEISKSGVKNKNLRFFKDENESEIILN
jgi:hypothetical protein